MQTYVQVHVSQLLIASTPGKGRGSPGAARHDRGSSAHEAGAEWDVARWLWNYIKHGRGLENDELELLEKVFLGKGW